MKDFEGRSAFITGGASGIGLGGEWRPMAAARHAALLGAMPEKLDPALLAMLQGRP